MEPRRTSDRGIAGQTVPRLTRRIVPEALALLGGGLVGSTTCREPLDLTRPNDDGPSQAALWAIGR